MAKQRIGKRGKHPDTRPARVRYWMGRHLELNKVKNLMRCAGMTRADATAYWRKNRMMRIPDNFLREWDRV